VTMTHVIQDAGGWRMLVSEGEIIETPPLKISECTLIVRVQTDVRQYFRSIIKRGFAHHVIAGKGSWAAHLESFAGQLGIEVCRI
jgi:L-arabinose isomerase